ncbi:MAG: hypothetical protein HRT72_09965 [Flavobacteriales bacterium]|nr:hypothetical protein [Flavobacteriales bacterium]
MKRKIFTFLLLGLSSLQSYSQLNRYYGFEEMDYNQNGSFITIDGGFDINSNALTNSFLKESSIGTELKDLNSSNHKSEKNLTGYDLQTSLVFGETKEEFLGISNAGYFIGIKTRDHLDISYTKDVFDLIFYGNKPFLGIEANLGPLSFQRIAFEQIQFGFFKSISNEKRTITTALGLALVKGRSGISVNLSDQTSLYTQERAEYIDFSMDGSISYTDQDNNGALDMNGIGISTDIYTKIDFENGDNINISISDFGTIKWNSSSTNYTNNESFHFDGIEIEDVLTINDSIFTDINKDSIQNNILGPASLSSFSTVLPAIIQIEGTKKLSNDKIYSTIGLRHQLNSNYIPYFYFINKYKFSDKILGGVKIAYGGYGKINLGLELSTSFKKILIVLGSSDVDALFDSNGLIGTSYYLSLHKLF